MRNRGASVFKIGKEIARQIEDLSKLKADSEDMDRRIAKLAEKTADSVRVADYLKDCMDEFKKMSIPQKRFKEAFVDFTLPLTGIPETKMEPKEAPFFDGDRQGAVPTELLQSKGVLYPLGQDWLPGLDSNQQPSG